MDKGMEMETATGHVFTVGERANRGAESHGESSFLESGRQWYPVT